jgi:hypothetical protein
MRNGVSGKNRGVAGPYRILFASRKSPGRSVPSMDRLGIRYAPITKVFRKSAARMVHPATLRTSFRFGRVALCPDP